MRERTPKTILVVEDEGAIREAVCRALADDGYETMAAASGEEAYGLIRSHRARIDWLFTDIRLPGALDGWRIAEEFRNAHPFRPVIYATASAADSGRKVSGSLFFRKPYRPSQIVSAFLSLSEASEASVEGVASAAPHAGVAGAPLGCAV
jgi:CheY-like chemotaxis protein